MRTLAACLGALCFSSAAIAAPDAVAFVADVSGGATIEGNGPVRFLGVLATGTRLLVGTHAQVVVTYAGSGTEYTARGPGEFIVGDREVKCERGAAPTKRQVSALRDPLTVSALSTKATASVRMRGASAAAEAPPATRLDADVAARVRRSEAGAKTFSARVAHAMLLHEVGARREARAAWARLASERPDLPELAFLEP
jgi:hypothetical protein